MYDFTDPFNLVPMYNDSPVLYSLEFHVLL